MSRVVLNSEKCTGCCACKNICPRKCVSMTVSGDGFYYPHINLEQCIECGLCSKVCPIDNVEFNSEPQKIIAYKAADDVRVHSTSGGFFTVISDYILNMGGIVYGAAFNKSFQVEHIRSEDVFGRDKMRCSKYVQSDIGMTYSLASADLVNNKTVLFSGTPCQIAGLNNYLKVRNIPSEKLITCDLVCHGTPSPVIWKDYIDFVSSKYKDKVIAVNFRDKSLGWHKPQLKITMQTHTQSGTEAQDGYYQMFYSNCILRRSCHVCSYSTINRVSDLTMADCWGVENSHPQWDDNKGLSLILINSCKGNDIIGKLGLAYDEIDLGDVRQPHLSHPAKVSKKREKFWRDYERKGFKYVLNVYGNYSVKSKVVRRAKKILLKVIRR